MQIEYGLLTDPEGRRVGIDLFKGNTVDAIAFKTAVDKVRKDSGLKELVFAGDRGMITKTRIADLRALEGAGWVTALKTPDIAALAADEGPLQLSLFDEQNLAESLTRITPVSGWSPAGTRPWPNPAGSSGRAC
jgi:transposase